MYGAGTCPQISALMVGCRAAAWLEPVPSSSGGGDHGGIMELYHTPTHCPTPTVLKSEHMLRTENYLC